MLLCTGRATGASCVCSTNARLGNKKTHWMGRGSRARITRDRMREQPFQQRSINPSSSIMQTILRHRRIGCTRAATGKARQSDRRHVRSCARDHPMGTRSSCTIGGFLVARIPFSQRGPDASPPPLPTGLGQYIPLHLAIASTEVTSIDSSTMASPLLLCLAAAALAVAVLASATEAWRATPPPLPVLPIPSAPQLKWQRREVIMFFHFGMNTFTDSEWGTGSEDPSLFRPAGLNATQWMDAARAAGASLVILVAKHHDGFCLWPSDYTAHSVRASPWRGGRGDVVREFVDAARARGVDAGLYLSPWDRHDERYGQEVAYNEYYEAQLHELLTGYGSVSEIWFDGAKGKNATNMTYHFQEWFQTVKQLQRSINIFSDDGPDVRWVGDEKGYAGTTCWSTVNRSMITIGEAGIEKYLNAGDPRGRDWVPPECDVSIRPGWFWHKNETAKPLRQLLEIYYNSVGRNCVLLLNAPPNSTGLVEDADIARLREFGAAVATVFGTDLAAGSEARASSERGARFAARNVLDGRDDTYWAPTTAEDGRRNGYWIELRRRRPGARARARAFNVVRIQEHVALGQRVERHAVYVDGAPVANGTTVGHKRLHRLPCPVAGTTVRVWITARRGPPLLSAVGLHYDPFVASDTM